MMSIIKTEWLKIKNYSAFLWVLSLTALIYPGVSMILYQSYKSMLGNEEMVAQFAKALIGNPLAFPEVWRTTAYVSSLWVFVPAIIVIMLITNEYSYKTNRQNIIDGWSRETFMAGKLMDVLIVTLVFTLMYTIVTLVLGFLNIDLVEGNRWSMIYY